MTDLEIVCAYSEGERNETVFAQQLNSFLFIRGDIPYVHTEDHTDVNIIALVFLLIQ